MWLHRSSPMMAPPYSVLRDWRRAVCAGRRVEVRADGAWRLGTVLEVRRHGEVGVDDWSSLSSGGEAPALLTRALAAAHGPKLRVSVDDGARSAVTRAQQLALRSRPRGRVLEVWASAHGERVCDEGTHLRELLQEEQRIARELPEEAPPLSGRAAGAGHSAQAGGSPRGAKALGDASGCVWEWTETIEALIPAASVANAAVAVPATTTTTATSAAAAAAAVVAPASSSAAPVSAAAAPAPLAWVRFAPWEAVALEAALAAGAPACALGRGPGTSLVSSAAPLRRCCRRCCRRRGRG